MFCVQSAYRPLHSTKTAFWKVCNDLLLNIYLGNALVLILLDLSASFDTIGHGLLLVSDLSDLV